jgi:hypothetical protein
MILKLCWPESPTGNDLLISFREGGATMTFEKWHPDLPGEGR